MLKEVLDFGEVKRTSFSFQKNSTLLTELNPEVIQAMFGWNQSLNFNFRHYLAGCEGKQHKPVLPCVKAQSHPPLLAGQAGNAGRTSMHTGRKGFPKAAARLGSTSSHFSTVPFLASHSTAANMASNDSSARGKTQRTNSTIHWKPPFPIHLQGSQSTSLPVGLC